MISGDITHSHGSARVL